MIKSHAVQKWKTVKWLITPTMKEYVLRFESYR
jgi:hypothetical protein